jgi:hypothetical protein
LILIVGGQDAGHGQGSEAERQKRDDDLQLIELGNSGFHGSATPSYYLVE